ncbi:MAG TPA: hypothetical protein VK152_06625 [Paludibacter sp.]|nr:hypothetical protein [Paludibacter sp.]
MKTAKVRIISQKRITDKQDKGWLFTWVEVYDSNTTSTEKEMAIWIKDKKDAYNEFMCNKML